MKAFRAWSLGALALVVGATDIYGQVTEVVIPGKVVTGFNRFLGQPPVNFGPPLRLQGWEAIGAFNPDGAEATPLVAGTPNNTLLATCVDPTFLNLYDVPGGVDPDFLNVPLRDVGTNVSLDGCSTRQPLPLAEESPPLFLTQASPGDPIRWRDWRRARGALSITCDESGRSEVVLRARNLLPNRLYTAWRMLEIENRAFPAPFGGVPNALTTDADGAGLLRRSLNYCPTDRQPGDPRLLAVLLSLQSDNSLNGVYPFLPEAGLPEGTISHPHLQFNIDGDELLEPEGWGSGDCLPDSTTQCLNNGRFAVEVDWKDFQGNSGQGRTVDFSSDDSGLFYFFDPNNTEAVIKVLNGCSFNDHFWVFASMATDVEYTLTVIDTQTGESSIYENPLGSAAPAITDTNAFATCP